MRSLFLKMFLWFCATTAAIFVFISVGFLRDTPSALVTNWRDLGHKAVIAAAHDSVLAWEHGGQAELARRLASVGQALGLPAALLNNSGSVLASAGLSLDAGVVSQISAAEEHDLTIVDRGASLAAVRVRGSDGAPYLFAVLLPPRQPGPWGRTFVVSLLLGGLLLCLLLARYITSPVIHLRKLTRQFSQADLSTRVTLPEILDRRDEIGQLARDFNHMASRIESLMQAQHRLIADVSHELRSPVTRLGLALGLMRQRGTSNDAASIARISREVDRLNALIGQLLTLSRLEYLNAPGPAEAFDLSTTVREIAADADFEASSAGVSVRMLRCDPCTVRGTPDLVRSAIENVVRNAVKYTGAETEVTMQLRRTADSRTADVVVQDQGPGLPESGLAHIFEPFYRVDPARDRHTGGTGLGLAITRRVIILHGGSVSAANRIGGGMEFRITLPVT